MSKNQRQGKEDVKGLEDLKEVTKGLKLKLVRPRLKQLNLKGIQTTIQEKVEQAQLIPGDIANALQFRWSVTEQIAQYPDNRIARKVILTETAADRQEMEDYLTGILGEDSDPVYRQVAATAYITTELSRNFHTRQEAEEALRELETRGLLLKDRNGAISINYDRYVIPNKFGLDPEDISELNNVISSFARVLKTLVSQQRQAETKKALKEANITPEQALNEGKNGVCLLEVPAESYIDERDDNKEKWRGGGQILVEFTDSEVVPVQGIGSIENLVRDMATTNVRLANHTLKREQPPGGESVRGAVAQRFGLTPEGAEAYVKKLRTLWYLIFRARKALKTKKAAQKLKEEFTAKAEITAMQAFGLNGCSGSAQTGVALLEFDGTFRLDDNQIYSLFFLASFGADGPDGKRFVEIVQVPEHLSSQLNKYLGQKFVLGDNFSELPSHLGRIFRGIYGQAEMAAAVKQ